MTAHLLTRGKAAGRKHWNPNLLSWKFHSLGRIWGWSQSCCLILLLNQQSTLLSALPQGLADGLLLEKGKVSFLHMHHNQFFWKVKHDKNSRWLKCGFACFPLTSWNFYHDYVIYSAHHLWWQRRIFLNIWRKCIKNVLVSHRPLETVTNLIIFHLSFCGWNYNLLISGF